MEANTDTAEQKKFADLLSALMDCVEKYQEGEGGEGNYLLAMNALRDIHKFKAALKTSVVYHHYDAVARAPAPPPVRPSAARKKMTDEMKRDANYKTCPTCGCLFADNSKLKRHMNTTEKCRHIRIEKEVALNTKEIFRDARYRPVNQTLTGRPALFAKLTPPDDECLTVAHPYRPQFITDFLLCYSHREEYVARGIANAAQSQLSSGLRFDPMTFYVAILRPGFKGTAQQALEHHTSTHLMWKPSASFLKRDPANAIVSASNFLTRPSYRYKIGWVEVCPATVDGNGGGTDMSWSFKVKTPIYNRAEKKQVECSVMKFNFTNAPGLAEELRPLTQKELHRLNCMSGRSESQQFPHPEYSIDWPLMENNYQLALEIWDEFGLGVENFERIPHPRNELPFILEGEI
jgi:hypothetical protein